MYEYILLIFGFLAIGFNHYILKMLEKSHQKNTKFYSLHNLLLLTILIIITIFMFIKFTWYYSILLTIGGLILGGGLVGGVINISRLFKTPMFSIILSITSAMLIILQLIFR